MDRNSRVLKKQKGPNHCERCTDYVRGYCNANELTNKVERYR